MYCHGDTSLAGPADSLRGIDLVPGEMAMVKRIRDRLPRQCRHTVSRVRSRQRRTVGLIPLTRSEVIPSM